MLTFEDHRSGPTTHAGPELSMLGGFRLRVGGQAAAVPEGSKRLLAYLALHDRAQLRSVVAGTLWPECNERRAAANLRASLWRLPCTTPARLVQSECHGLSIAPNVRVDVREVQAVGWSLIRSPAIPLANPEPELFFEELLPGWYDDWVIVERERLGQLRLHFLEALTFQLLQQHRVAEALDVALRLVGTDPLREGSQRALISVYRAEGSHGQAAKQLARYRELINTVFGCEPSHELLQLALGKAVAATA